jgi:DNA-binding HxlR family transcriptional regulator
MIDSSSFTAMPSRRIALESVFNALNSLSMLNRVEQLSGLNAWVVQTAAALTPEQRYINRLIFDGLRDALVPEKAMPDFPTYLSHLAAQDPDVLRKRALERLRSRFSRRMQSEDAAVAPGTERLLSDVQAYLICAEYIQVDAPFDPALQSAVHALLQDANALQRLLVSHLDMLWQETFSTEWRRIRSSLRWQVEMFTRSVDEEATLEEEFQAFTGRELPAHLPAQLSQAQEIILVPSWHTGQHVTLWEDDTTRARLFFSEPPNYDVALLRATPMRRSELRARLDALADETRLRIIDLLVQRNEMHAQDIITELGLSQSSVSRHLKQLVSMGYLYERRSEGANKTYRLSSFYFARTARAVEHLLAGEQTRQAHDEDTSQPQALRRFLDKSGKLALWPPAKQRDKLLILEYLATFFEPGRVYNEKEVNNLLILHSIVKDSAALRRALYEYRFMNRTRDGSQYWLIGSDLPGDEGQ